MGGWIPRTLPTTTDRGQDMVMVMGAMWPLVFSVAGPFMAHVMSRAMCACCSSAMLRSMWWIAGGWVGGIFDTDRGDDHRGIHWVVVVVVELAVWHWGQSRCARVFPWQRGARALLLHVEAP